MDARFAYRMRIWVAVILSALTALLGYATAHGHL